MKNLTYVKHFLNNSHILPKIHNLKFSDFSTHALGVKIQNNYKTSKIILAIAHANILTTEFQ
jgi:hypothetical protein